MAGSRLAFTHAVAVGLPPSVVREFARRAHEIGPDLEVEGFARSEELGELALSDAGCLLLLPLTSPDGNGLDLLRRLRARGAQTAAVLLVSPEEMSEGIPTGALKGLGPVDLLPLTGSGVFDLRRVLETLGAYRELAQRAVEHEARWRESEEHRLLAERRAKGLELRLTELAVDDPLTGLRNERYILQRVEEGMKVARRYEIPVVCLLVGIDGLADLREHHGAGAGDPVLMQAAHRLRRGIREVDLPARYGNDGFLVLSVYTRPPEALALAQRVRAMLAEPPMRFQGRELQLQTVVGVAILRPEMEGPAELIQTAAEALAQAREHGGPSVVVL